MKVCVTGMKEVVIGPEHPASNRIIVLEEGEEVSIAIQSEGDPSLHGDPQAFVSVKHGSLSVTM